ncbi:MAG: hypothetical protein JW892_03990 [Anaerolineae bacterium]|nr:hypothetical protein [Anaerolineae bacterium]
MDNVFFYCQVANDAKKSENLALLAAWRLLSIILASTPFVLIRGNS